MASVTAAMRMMAGKEGEKKKKRGKKRRAA